MKKSTILVVDDDQDLLTAVRLLLKPKVGEVIVESNPENIMSILSKREVNAVLLDMNFKSAVNTGNEGLFWLSKIRSSYPVLPIIMITAYGAVDLAVKSLKNGASDFIVKPWQNETLLTGVGEVLSTQKNKFEKQSANKLQISDTELLGDSEVMEELQYKISKIAPTDANILILGENGTGKDVIAREIHKRSLRAKSDYIKVDVGALTDSLFESELFGYKKGAFTDAREDRKGRVELAHKGTLFLDEIGNISLQQQAKLLTVLQNRQVTALGSHIPLEVDIRLLCATNVPIRELSDENRFRKDLIYRINTVEIQVPPLRSRGKDIGLLANYFLTVYARKYGKAMAGFSDESTAKLNAYHFPGNVRELQYSIERAVIMSDSDEIIGKDLIFSPIERSSQPQPVETDYQHLETLERITIAKVIEKHNGNISRAARELGLTRSALYRRLEKYNL
ncbi:sigma-54-dependent transcriptional regulator [Sphingobacterium sp. SYP-B4668]|uniref:sigma-54-dependent transcriptional regulator n=1 Tax=Sphingobacterium sp. SYP-B4668 TaxID=2996035 RepID=UPI0022DE3191|nr:sigma-54 dependent transcriptional regulator [Sphingobacterium sp. SYP-B4668]